MSKTIRRKGLKNVHGLYEWRNEVRNRENASEVYYHSDMMSRKGGSYDFTSQPCREIKKATKRLTRTQIRQLSKTSYLDEDFDIDSKSPKKAAQSTYMYW
ncbi:hypothetical protein Meda_013 [Salmonella phage Meda]|jgi:hypothetical protein|uniref:Uncharacterized protein n=6 Tax=Felixounavirus TaxID=1198140 RepID=A0A6B9XCW8_9CAUD|nr:hypothetical protein FDJ21_gp033 [Salmonella phage BPS17L1]AXY86273.1 hypothetical protein Meda_013 [Salmonella phage Meda]QHR65111.1 hypothetical protein garuso_46 [Escherichia phage garuso]QHR70087.1 hypothetical protein pinkbiff_92 [Escherichia phage pinkbiff]QHR74235.1 hypothetical protein bumzen_75 [Escherichia phage bumzen]UGL60399.1 hypothetical protein [Salmonella phage vB_SenM-pSJ21]